MPNKKLLILGGIGEAAQLAQQVVDVFGNKLEVVISYAGVTGHQPDLPCEIRVGGFGGPSGLINYLKENNFTHLIDATHPFAEKISMHAYVAAQDLEIPFLILWRDEWRAQIGDRWLDVPDMEEAARQVAAFGVKTFLTIGVKELSAFDGIADVAMVVRLMNEPAQKLPLANYECVIARPPFSVEAERELIREKQIRLLVSKNSGGDATRAKLEAARLEGVSVIMIQRPPQEPTDYVNHPREAIQWLNMHGV